MEIRADADPTPPQRAAAEERWRSLDAQVRAAFGRAAFLPYALDDRWTGARRFGGWGGSNGTVTSLTLTFANEPRDLQAPEVRVTTELPSRHGGIDPLIASRMSAFMLALQQIQYLWQQTGVLRDDVRRAAFPRDGVSRDDPTVVWDHVPITVESEGVEFAVLSESDHWVAQATIESLVVAIQSRHWALDSVGLRSESNVDAYTDRLHPE
jgi:hypothetical protein